MKAFTVAIAAIVLATVAVSGAAVVEVELHLRSRNTEAVIEQALVDRSTPGSALFRQHLSAAELADLVGADDTTIANVLAFLRNSGATVRRVLSTRDIVECAVPQSSMAAAHFGLTPADFVSEALRRPVSAPAAIAGDLAHVIASTDASTVVGKKPAMGKKKNLVTQPGAQQTPAAINKRYNVPAGNPVYPANFSQGVGEYQESYFTQNDIATFSSHFNLKQPVVSVSGPNAKSRDDVEGTLDVEYMTAISGAAHTWWISSNKPGAGSMPLNFPSWAEQVLTIPTPPTVLSISWGLGESEYNKKSELLVTDNNAFRKLALRGITVFVASGDSGPGARQFSSCKIFDPSWPASSPYVTAVGATYSNSESDAETSVSFSGGGFSNYFGTPAWQKPAVQAYLSSGATLPKSHFFNATGRAFPDVSALGTNFMVFSPKSGGASQWWPVSGTSCASPTFAGVITRVNAARMSAGKPALGFLNPAIYKLGKVGKDVTAGINVDPDCLFGIIKIPGFPAVAGWDAVSGLGTPDYAFLLSNL